MKKPFEKPQIEVTEFQPEDMITVSSQGTGALPGVNPGW